MAVVRPARIDEAKDIIALYRWLFEPPGRQSANWDPERALAALREAIGSPNAAVLVAEVPDLGLVGLCVAYRDIHSVRFGYRTWIEDLVVAPESRSQGIGSQMLSHAREWAKANGAHHFEVDTGGARVDAQRFYENQDPSYRNISYGWEL